MYRSEPESWSSIGASQTAFNGARATSARVEPTSAATLRSPGASRLRRTLGGAMLGLALSALASGTPAAAANDGLPTGPVKLAVGFAPGGASDLTARVFAEQISKATGVDVIVENRPGASSQIANNYVSRAEPDGKTLLLVTSAAFTVHPAAYSHLDYNVDSDFRPIASLVDIPTAIATSVEKPYSDMKSFADWVKQHPDEATVGVATMGGYSHLGTIAVSQAIGIPFESVIYKGASPMLVDTASARIAAGADAVASMMPLYQGGKIRFLGISGTERLTSLPDVPTVKEQGFPEMATSFYAVYAPAGVSDQVAAAWEKAFLDAAKAPEVIQKLQTNGLVVQPLDHAQLDQRVQSQRKMWEPIIKEHNIKLD